MTPSIPPLLSLLNSVEVDQLLGLNFRSFHQNSYTKAYRKRTLCLLGPCVLKLKPLCFITHPSFNCGDLYNHPHTPLAVSHIAVKLHNGHGREDKAIPHCAKTMSGSRPGGTELLDPAVQ